ncbi:tRNA uridine-5-carboxymethylaminomethyl(34) synthesis GTPase MnmE [Rhizobium halophytocola]|uniref:tRNA modification GTPase MnmE n=1 Tax=Rhizobium halophytocola TaxID=735519 RepID=A0ABS4E1S5_9HYPH|nr:tRNA uridine-5-carboxymethylaminomethyl(34) synthesis GTPase MnmE [Rhizobium halophytocola]MBP1851854.1 tRNA modification GTPase [Rhizobium halophytocola]
MPAGDTIYALSSGGLPSGVAVIRVSGPAAFEVCRRLAGDVPAPRQAALRSIRDRNGELLDHGLVLSFVGPHSFTGEDCIELQIHGGRAVVTALLKTLGAFSGCRLAEAGEFSRRAFENGKLDLVEIEGLADLLAAETEMQRRLATEQSRGALSALYMGWRDRLLHARAMIEAEFDFSEEEDIPDSVAATIWTDMGALSHEIKRHLQGYARGEIIRDGFKVVITGPPNAGKSSLMNALAGRDVAIVTEYAGTTRDVLSVDLDLDGFLVKLYDTAGIREASDVVEQEGVRRAAQQIADADLVLHLSAVGDADIQLPSVSVPVRKIGTKADLAPGIVKDYDAVISTQADLGLGDIKTLISNEIKDRVGDGAVSIPSRLRQQEHLSACVEALDEALRSATAPLEVRAEALRRSADWLGRLTGRIDTEMLLGAIFSEFCVGK